MKTETIKSLVTFLFAFTVAISVRADTITWTNTSGGNWSVAANWNPNQVPGSSDDAVITTSGNYTVTLDTSPTVNSLALGGVSGTQTLNTAGNNFAVMNPSAINSNGIFVLNGGLLAGAFNFGGTLNWSGGSLGNGASLTVASNAVLNIEGSMEVQGPLTNCGTVNWEAGTVEVDGIGGGYSGAIWNQAGALWDIQCDQVMTGPWLTAFNNMGVLQKDTATGVTSFNDVDLANSGGTVHAESGTLQFNGGSDLGGVFRADASAAIYFNGGNMTLSSPPNFQGPGPVELTGGNLTLANFVGTFSVNGSILVGQSTIAAGGTINWINSTLGNGASLTVASNAVLNIEGSMEVQGPLTNCGTVNWEAGTVEVDGIGGGYSGAIWNQAGALWDIQCDQVMTGPWLTAFNNMGVLQKDTATGVTSFNDVDLANSGGTVHAESGTLQFNGGSDLGGVFRADASAAIYFNGGNMMLSSPPNFQGPGPVELTGGNLTLANFVGTFSVNGSILVGQSTIAAGGTINWINSTLGNGASLTVASNAVLNIEGSMEVQGALTNCGTVNWEAGTVEVDGIGGGYSGAIWNQAGALWDIQCDQVMTGPWLTAFNNMGVLQKDTATGVTSFNDVDLANSGGTVHAESGTLQFNGGSDLGGVFRADASAAIYFNGGNMTLSSPPNFQGPGPVELTGGNLTLINFVGAFGVNGSILVGQSTIAAGGTINWINSTLGNGASLTVASNGVLNIEGNMDVQGALTNCGTVNWEAGTVEVDGIGGGYSGAIWNQAGALWDIQCDQVMTGPWLTAFNNMGVLQKDTATGVTSFNDVDLANNGSLYAKAGTISLNASYTETASARQVIGIGGTVPDSDYGQLQFSSPTFAGSFNVTLLNGFRPGSGNSFSVLSYPSLMGDFSSMDGLDLGNGLKLAPQFGNTYLTLVAASYPINVRPALSLYLTPGGTLVSWPLDFTGWQLQTTTNLIRPVWTPVTVPGTNNNIVLPRTSLQGFFRLETN